MNGVKIDWLTGAGMNCKSNFPLLKWLILTLWLKMFDYCESELKQMVLSVNWTNKRFIWKWLH